MVKLLIVTPKYPPQPGGASYVFSMIAEKLASYEYGGNYVEVLTSSQNGLPNKETRNGVRITRLFPYYESKWSKIVHLPFTFMETLGYFLKNHNKFDVVETHTVGEICVFSQIMAKLFEKKLVKHALDMSMSKFWLKHPKADSYINCGTVMTKRMINFGLPMDKIHEIRLPIVRIKNKTYKKTGKKIFLFIGEVSQRKGIKDLLDVMKEITTKNFELWIVGSGPMVDDVKTAVQVDKRIKYLGLIEHDKVIELMKKTDALVHPTYADVMPLTILEAMMMGNAIISSDIGEIRKNVSDAGLFIQSGDKTALKNAIELTLKKDLAKMKRNALKRFALYAEEDVYRRNLEAVMV
ncbi:MAG: glycosyltransferase family 4 protein [Candidatus Aenigmatarchaeota archaeon]